MGKVTCTDIDSKKEFHFKGVDESVNKSSLYMTKVGWGIVAKGTPGTF